LLSVIRNGSGFRTHGAYETPRKHGALGTSGTNYHKPQSQNRNIYKIII